MKSLFFSVALLVSISSCSVQKGTAQVSPDGTLMKNATEASSIYLTNDGKMGIGKKNPKDKLEVNGQIHAKSVKVDLEQWADVVFKKDYPLTPLRDIETYIKQNGHLPEIPSEETVSKEGVELGDMSRLLLQKIEELTLHLIEKDKQIVQLFDDVQILRKEVQQLKMQD